MPNRISQCKSAQNNRDETSDTKDGDSSIAAGQQNKKIYGKKFTLSHVSFINRFNYFCGLQNLHHGVPVK